MSITQSTVLITGASSGIGLVAAQRFSAKGYRVFGTSRNISRVTPVEGVEYVELDVTDDQSVSRAVDEVITRVGDIDVLVNNA